MKKKAKKKVKTKSVSPTGPRPGTKGKKKVKSRTVNPDKPYPPVKI